MDRTELRRKRAYIAEIVEKVRSMTEDETIPAHLAPFIHMNMPALESPIANGTVAERYDLAQQIDRMLESTEPISE